MKAECPNCEAVYQLDDSKIPEKGVYATCAKCQTRFHVKKEPKIQKEERQEEIIPSPNCGHVNISTDTCVRCGSVLSKEDKKSLKITIDVED